PRRYRRRPAPRVACPPAVTGSGLTLTDTRKSASPCSACGGRGERSGTKLESALDGVEPRSGPERRRLRRRAVAAAGDRVRWAGSADVRAASTSSRAPHLPGPSVELWRRVADGRPRLLQRLR